MRRCTATRGSVMLSPAITESTTTPPQPTLPTVGRASSSIASYGDCMISLGAIEGSWNDQKSRDGAIYGDLLETVRRGCCGRQGIGRSPKYGVALASSAASDNQHRARRGHTTHPGQDRSDAIRRVRSRDGHSQGHRASHIQNGSYGHRKSSHHEGNGELVPDAGSYAPVTVLVDERVDGVHISYDRMASLLAPYGDENALSVARDLDAKVEDVLRQAAG